MFIKIPGKTLTNSYQATDQDVERSDVMLTNAYGDVGRPLVVVLAGNGFLPNQLEAKLALEA